MLTTIILCAISAVAGVIIGYRYGYANGNDDMNLIDNYMGD